ncbi:MULTISPECIES: RNA-binding S4 domain-containing protein [Methylobacterium]|jgi:ribosome-associated heat shock protein Hsp15|uniref:RNA-binding protein S4 n=2 Tax=Methylobacterium TaxID=407 RepID=A0A0C6FXF8_9HYPH|nr:MULTISPECIES: RNA-binding S4 domain-containing protein [Methylobacterium]MBK3400119.1 RNA-binding S4 domain-containing protein [Methylobacterium ajmalii]MBK3410519.1 RNA-binding S4 domain-containing protein [Methylobacterium ajmalii]MBK3425042.1 RNA-binding S4 domain-containing protein [Methylobacterium ajmalii]MBZ6415945.1 RNA-binding S4 domain-containing protein [Methylobacterium sp.]SFF33108.1 heat shock protein Hsp15 [Methylobacterium sp. yr596]
MREDRQRLDKWLWFARFAKTRSLAARLVEDGYVRVNGHRADAPAKALAVGDVVTVAAQHVTAAVRVRDLGMRRGPAPEARLLYADLAADPSADPADGAPGDAAG